MPATKIQAFLKSSIVSLIIKFFLRLKHSISSVEGTSAGPANARKSSNIAIVAYHACAYDVAAVASPLLAYAYIIII